MDCSPPLLGPPLIAAPENQLAIRRAVAHLCGRLAWSVLHEVPLPNNRRADLLALRPDGGFVCIEVKSGPHDFLSDAKWPEYRPFCDVVGPYGPLPGVIAEADLLRDAPPHRLTPAARRALTHRFATLAANRLSTLEHPSITASLRAALRVE